MRAAITSWPAKVLLAGLAATGALFALRTPDTSGRRTEQHPNHLASSATGLRTPPTSSVNEASAPTSAPATAITDPPPATSCSAEALTPEQSTYLAAAGTGEIDTIVKNSGTSACTLGAQALGALAAEVIGSGNPGSEGSSPGSAPSPAPLPVTGPATAPPDTQSIPGGGTTSLQFVVDDLAPLGSTTCPIEVLPSDVRGAVSGIGALVSGVLQKAGLNGNCTPASIPSSTSVPAVGSLPSLSATPPPTSNLPGASTASTLPVVSTLPGLSKDKTLPSLPSLPSVLGRRNSSSPNPSSPSKSDPSPSPAPSSAQYASGSSGYDISWPQCGQSYPPPSSVAVVGVNDGSSFTTNPCVASEAAWAGASLDTYMNLNSPDQVDSDDASGPAGACAAGDDSCLAYNYGYNAAQQALGVSTGDQLAPRMWWLDIEEVGSCTSDFPTGGNGYWSCDQSLNSLTIQGALDALRSSGADAGVYSTSYQWSEITGGYTPTGGAPPNWLAGDNASPPSSWCSGSNDFAAGPPWLLQLWPSQTYDQDQAC
jgi:hypothetical protein